MTTTTRTAETFNRNSGGGSRRHLRTSYVVDSTIEPIFTGGKVQVYCDGAETDHLQDKGGKKYLVLNSGNELHFRNPETAESVLAIQAVSSADAAAPIETVDNSSAWQSFLAHRGSLYTANKDGLIEAWSFDLVKREKQLRRSWKSGNPRNSPVQWMVHHPRADLLILGFADGSLSGWDSVGGFCTHNFKAKSGGNLPISSLLICEASDELVVGSENGAITAWNLRKAGASRGFSAHVSAVTGLALDSSRDRLVSVGRDKIVSLHTFSTGKSTKTFSANESIESLLLAAFEKDSVLLAGERGIVSQWSLQSGKMISQSKALTASGHAITQLHHFNEEAVLAISNELQIIRLSAEKLAETSRLMGHFGEVTDFSLIAGKSLAVATNSPDICIFPEIPSLACHLLSGHTEAVLALAHSPGFLVSASRDSTARIWSLSPDSKELGQMPLVLEGHTAAVSFVAVCPSHAKGDATNDFLIASASSDLTIKLWSFSLREWTVQSLWTIKAHDKEINALAFSPDSKHLISAAQDKSIKIWSVSGPNSGRPVQVLGGHKRGVWSIAAYGEFLASGSADRTLKIWRKTSEVNEASDANETNVSGFTCWKTLEGHSNSILKVSFLNKGNQVISCGSDGLVKIWDVQKSECLTTFDEHLDRIWALVMENDGDRFITGDASAVIKIWRDNSEAEREADLERQNQLLLKEQELQIHLLRKDYPKAIALAISLDQPFRLFGLLDELVRDKTVQEALSLIKSLLFTADSQDSNDPTALFIPENFIKLLKYLREWNLSYRRAFPCQIILAAILQTPKLAQIFQERAEAKDLLKDILVYTDKHFERTDELLITSHLVDFALLKMQ